MDERFRKMIGFMASGCATLCFGAAGGAISTEHPSDLPKGPQWELVWHDEFNGTELDRTKWDYRLNIMQKRHHTFTNAGVTVSGGLCHLTLIENNGQYYSPHLETGHNIFDQPPAKQNSLGHDEALVWPVGKLQKDLFLHRYGYWECRCRLQGKPGWWSAFWIQSRFNGISEDPAEAGTEIDVMEAFEPGEIAGNNLHWGGCGPDYKNDHSKQHPWMKRMGSTEFHTYGVWWTPTNYVFYVDGNENWRSTNGVSRVKEFVLISTECMGYRAGQRDQPSPRLKPSFAGDEFQVDYVRVFDEVSAR